MHSNRTIEYPHIYILCIYMDIKLGSHMWRNSVHLWIVAHISKSSDSIESASYTFNQVVYHHGAACGASTFCCLFHISTRPSSCQGIWASILKSSYSHKMSAKGRNDIDKKDGGMIIYWSHTSSRNETTTRYIVVREARIEKNIRGKAGNNKQYMLT